MKKSGLLGKVLLLCILLYTVTAHAAEKRDTLRILFVGNSYVYYNNLPQMVSLISDSLTTKLICTKSTVGAANLGEHWQGSRGLQTRKLIENGKYDIVVIQDNSMWPIQNPDSVYKYGNLLCNLIRSRGAKPYVYNTWARKKTPETQGAINAVYAKLAADNQAVRVPVGDTWALAQKLDPAVELFNADGSHPSSLGTFLIALDFVKKTTGSLPKKFQTVYNYPGIDRESIRLMQLTDAEIAFCVSVVNQVL